MNEQFSAFLDNEATRDESDSVVNALLRDPALRASWSRQHWLRTTLRAPVGEMPVALDAGFSSRVMQAIANDDRPETVAPAAATLSSVPVAASRRRGWRRRGVTGLAAVASAAGIAFLVGNPMTSGTRPENQVARTASSPTSERTRGTVASADVGAAGQSGIISMDALANQARGDAAPSRDTAHSTITSQVIAGPAAAGAASPSGSMLARAGSASGTARTVAAADTAASDASGTADHWSISDPALESELNGYLVEHNGLARSYGMSGTTPAFVRVATYGQETTQ